MANTFFLLFPNSFQSCSFLWYLRSQDFLIKHIYFYIIVLWQLGLIPLPHCKKVPGCPRSAKNYSFFFQWPHHLTSKNHFFGTSSDCQRIPLQTSVHRPLPVGLVRICRYGQILGLHFLLFPSPLVLEILFIYLADIFHSLLYCARLDVVLQCELLVYKRSWHCYGPSAYAKIYEDLFLLNCTALRFLCSQYCSR